MTALSETNSNMHNKAPEKVANPAIVPTSKTHMNISSIRCSLGFSNKMLLHEKKFIHFKLAVKEFYAKNS